MNTFILTLTLSFLLIFFYVLGGRRLSSPSVAWTGIFLIALLNGLTNYNKWLFNLSSKTVLLIGGATLIFGLCSFGTHTVMNRKSSSNPSLHSSLLDPSLESGKSQSLILLNRNLHITFLIFQIFNALLIVYYVRAAGARLGIDNSLSGAIGATRQASISFGTDYAALPGFVGSINSVCLGCVYLYLYISLKNFMSGFRQHSVLILVNCGIALVTPFLDGSRGTAISLLLSVTLFYLVFSEEANHNRTRLKTLVSVLLLGTLILFIFINALELLGRSSSGMTPYYYLSVYLGAPLKNLDVFLTTSYSSPTYTGIHIYPSVLQIFAPFSNKIASIISSQQADDLRIFTTVNGYDTGNVNTALAAYVNDFGFVGALILVASMAIIMQFSYENISVSKSELKSIIYTISYSIMWAGVLTLFFADRFYRVIFTTTFLKYIIIWVILLHFILHIPKPKQITGGITVRGTN